MREPSTPGEVVLDVADVSVSIDGVERLKSIDFSLRAGEIARHYRSFRQRPDDAGASPVGYGQARQGRTPAVRRADRRLTVDGPSGLGSARIPEIATRKAPSAKWPFGRTPFSSACRDFRATASSIGRAGQAFAGQIIDAFDVRGGRPTTTHCGCSPGGNMQKLILGRNLIDRPRILLAASRRAGSTRGLSPRCTSGCSSAARGNAVLLISEDLRKSWRFADAFSHRQRSLSLQSPRQRQCHETRADDGRRME